MFAASNIFVTNQSLIGVFCPVGYSLGSLAVCRNALNKFYHCIAEVNSIAKLIARWTPTPIEPDVSNTVAAVSVKGRKLRCWKALNSRGAYYRSSASAPTNNDQFKPGHDECQPHKRSDCHPPQTHFSSQPPLSNSHLQDRSLSSPRSPAQSSSQCSSLHPTPRSIPPVHHDVIPNFPDKLE